ncbi:hypothetical protein KIN20_000140 [Parelaphostrongylus tenuis]|uniref:Uncharacterized protein n=1 Tax=Parelaphostrongylus tenuis TaxID=148309 RepID=A0AAD5MAR0_PARTN|nr:hypothetical protein KIN20_000140 [Parelaphostrongylus tenuis]
MCGWVIRIDIKKNCNFFFHLVNLEDGAVGYRSTAYRHATLAVAFPRVATFARNAMPPLSVQAIIREGIYPLHMKESTAKTKIS